MSRLDRRRRAARALLAGALVFSTGCGGHEQPSNAISLGLLLSYSGQLAANSINSERGLLMAIDAVNAAGGVAGRPLQVEPRDTRTDPTTVAPKARGLLDEGASLFIGPDTPELAVAVLPVLKDQTLILPSFATSYTPFGKPNGWFVMGPGRERIACELVAQLMADGRKKAAVLIEPGGYSGVLAAILGTNYALMEMFLPRDQPSDPTTIQPIMNAPVDSYVLAAFPAAGSSLINALTAVGALHDPKRWYLSPILHTPAFLENIPRGALEGARGVAPGVGPGGPDFAARFQARWQDTPLDDAYAYYDAGAIAALALQRGIERGGAIPKGAALAPHVAAVTQKTGMPVQWNELAKGLDLLRKGQEIDYVGVSSAIEFDIFGRTSAATTKWWVIQGDHFMDVPSMSNCQ